jgi:HlyD family secretion protein
VKVKFLKPDEFVKPEMNARVTFLSTAPPKTATETPQERLFAVPKAAVVDREGGKAVFVVSEGVAQIRPIKIGREVSGNVYVSSGLSGSESIIIGDTLNELKVGDRVVVGQ